MATRALIGMIETDAAGNQILTSTYNHYDGYPESLGVALNNHYDDLQSAKRIANQGYISFLDPETGAIDAKNKDKAGKDNIPDDFEEAMYEIHAIADSMGADYVYIYDFDAADWLDSRNESKIMINKFRGSGVADQFTGGYEYDSYEDDPDNPLGIPGDNALGLEEENMDNKVVGDTSSVVRDAKRALKGKPNLDIYIDSLTNDIRLRQKDKGDDFVDDTYDDYGDDDWEMDYEDYISDKGADAAESYISESLKNTFQHRAGIIK